MVAMKIIVDRVGSPHSIMTMWNYANAVDNEGEFYN